MTTLVISNYRDPHSTRPEAEMLIKLAKRGMDIHVMTYEDADHYINAFTEAGITVIPFHPKRKFDKKESKRIREYLVNNSIDNLVLFNSNASIPGIRASKGLDVQVILYRGASANLAWWEVGNYFKYYHPRVDAIVCNSSGVEEAFHKHGIVDKSKTHIILKGHDLNWYADIEPINAREKYGIHKDALLLINVANNQKVKGIPYLLEAMNLLPNDANVELLIAGRKMNTKENLEIIGGNERIHLLGFQNQVLALVASCDAFILPSTGSESITKSVIEAMSLSVAPLISNIPGNRELVIHGHNGLVFEKEDPKAIADAIMTMYDNRELCEVYGKLSKERIANELNHLVTVDKWEELLMNEN